MLINHPDLQSLQATLIDLPMGARGIRKTTEIMAQLASEYKTDPVINARALTIVQLAPPKDGPREVTALFHFVRDSIRYVADVRGVETLRTPDWTLKLRAGDCDDKTLLLGTLLETLGYEVRFVVTGYTPDPNFFEHVYLIVFVDGYGWIALDPSERNAVGWEPPDPTAYYEQEIPI
jgi:transglutaminase-like putative cysteine protease